MKKVERALFALEWTPPVVSLEDVLYYECRTKEARCASLEGWATSRLGIYLVFWENQIIKKFPGDIWSIRKNDGWLVPTAFRPNFNKGTEVWVKGKPHAIKIKKSLLTGDIKKLCRKMKLTIIEY